MSAHAGERAQETGTYVCEKCGEAVRVTDGEKIPTCPNCGNDTFGRNESGAPRPQRKGDREG